jgi:hypothetical protein
MRTADAGFSGKDVDFWSAAARRRFPEHWKIIGREKAQKVQSFSRHWKRGNQPILKFIG